MKPVQAIPEGFHTITPYLAVHRVRATIEFLKTVFDAKDVHVHSLPSGQIMNAELRIGNSMVMLGEKPEGQETWPAMLYMYVEDVDGAFKKASKSPGARIIMEPIDHFYGDRSGAIEDPSGNQWWIATRKENLSEDELMRRAATARGSK